MLHSRLATVALSVVMVTMAVAAPGGAAGAPVQGTNVTGRLDGRPFNGTVRLNSYEYYRFRAPPGSFKVGVALEESGASGAGVYVGAGYCPVDGVSDWDQITIYKYPAEVVVDALQENVTYCVGVQGLDNSPRRYSLRLTWLAGPPMEVAPLLAGDEPLPGSVSAHQYAYFSAHLAQRGNFSFGSYLRQTGGPFEDGLTVQVAHGYVPRTGRFDYQAKVSDKGAWRSLEFPFVRANSTYFFSVQSDNPASFYVRVALNDTRAPLILA